MCAKCDVFTGTTGSTHDCRVEDEHTDPTDRVSFMQTERVDVSTRTCVWRVGASRRTRGRCVGVSIRTRGFRVGESRRTRGCRVDVLKRTRFCFGVVWRTCD